MLSSRDIIDTVAGFLEKENAENIALDTVMVSTSGHRLISEDSVDSLIEKLFPLADIVTPNLPEAEVLAGVPIESREQMKSVFWISQRPMREEELWLMWYPERQNMYLYPSQ